jgi:hypothetical protein
VSPPTPARDLRPFKDYDEDEDDGPEDHVVLQQQQQVMEGELWRA